MLKPSTIASLLFTLMLGVMIASAQERPRAKVVRLGHDGGHDSLLLGGPPETVTMKSGLVTLQAGQSVGKHSTRGHANCSSS